MKWELNRHTLNSKFHTVEDLIRNLEKSSQTLSSEGSKNGQKK